MAIQDKTLFKMEMAARFRVTHPNSTFAEIAELLGMTTSAVANLMSTPAYRNIAARLNSKTLGYVDAEIMDNDLIERHYRAKLKCQGIPLAVDFLIQAASGRVNGLPVSDAVQCKASEAILDRDGTFVKVSRVNASVEHRGATDTADDDVANNIIDKMKNSTPVNAAKFIN